jgi:hypothetical protein
MKYLTTIILLTYLNATAMAKEIKTEILINATPEKVWSILTSFDNYQNWNPFIKSIKGEAKVGNKIKVCIQPPNSKAMTFKPRVRAFETNKELRWLGHLLFPGLFDGDHEFQLIDNGKETTTFKQSEKFKGILVGLLNLENTKKGFEAMNEKIKEMAERK